MRRAIVLFAAAFLAAGCGAHRVTFEMPLDQPQPTFEKTTAHAHGIGPLIIGGGGFFFLFNELSPALINYTGTVDTREICPNGFTRISHGHTFGQSSASALASWILIVNMSHESNVDWECLAE